MRKRDRLLLMRISLSKKTVVLFTVFVDVLGIGVVVPIMPFFVQSFDPSPFAVTGLFVAFAFFSFLSAPMLGALSDRYGRRPVFLVSIASTCLGWIVFAAGRQLWVLYLGRIIDGLAAGNISTAQSALSDIAKDRKERMRNLGSIGAVFGVGFILGPMIGGLLGNIDHRLPFWFVAGLSFLNLLMAARWLPETRKGAVERTPTLSDFDPTLPIRNAFRDRDLRPVFLAWFLFGTAFAAQQAVFALYMGRLFGAGEAMVGVFTAFVGAMIVFNQGFLLKRFWFRRFDERALEPVLLVLLSAAFLIMGLPFPAAFAFGVFLLSLVQPVIRVTMNDRFSHDEARRGELLGMSASVMSLSMIVGPIAAGWLFDVRPYLPFLFAAAVVAFTLALLRRNRGVLA
ncbi:MAG: TCR/Tet family MFS transporter [Candidatus Moranbacteria bacterium]|nr:TCR/Tet family MFS transporter [Candidatus Moranbacteria bacterium]